MPDIRARLVVSSDSTDRLEVAREWLASHDRDAQVLIVGPTQEAADDLARSADAARGSSFGLRRMTLARVAVHIATPALAARGWAPGSALALSAVAARAIHGLVARDDLSHFAPVAGRPGFPLAVSRTVGELRMNGIEADSLRPLGPGGSDLASLVLTIEREMGDVALADRAGSFTIAIEAAGADPPPDPVGLPMLLLDVPVATRLEADLIEALARSSPRVLATVPEGDAESLADLARCLRCKPERIAPPHAPSSIARLKTHLFEDPMPPQAPLDDTVTLASWPGEARECVEIARRIQTEAARGVPFDRMAILLRSPEDYRTNLEEALRRAEIPAHFARGSLRPHPAGRAMLALLACAAEGLSARRFAEYLSLSQVPGPAAADVPDRGWAPPDHDLLRAMEAGEPAPEPGEDDLAEHPDTAAVVEGTLRAPWRWERLIVDASVIGGRDRWSRRLAGLEAELRLKLECTEDEDPARAALLEKQIQDLAHLGDFALPVIDRLASLPRRAHWGEWLEHLRSLAASSLRDPDLVLSTLAELSPLSPVGPIDLDEVQLVLGPRLRDLTEAPAERRYGRVFVSPVEAARGMAFDVVFVPGLAERLFPRKIVEDPILLDEDRRSLDGARLATQATRAAAERLALRLAAGAARERIHLSYPRLDVEKARPRVPSFYALETLRAAEGTLPGFDRLAERAEREAGGGRLGWPAPARATEAIDDAEYDLSLLGPILTADPETTAGAAHYLLSANPHLARALRARGRRWLRRWTPADGLVDPDGPARESLERHQLSSRSFSPTALQNYAVCPYQFFLQALMRLEPREEPEAIETLDPLTRGSLFHDVQFLLLTRLREEGLLPVRESGLEAALEAVDETLDRVALEYADKLCPAIPKVWEDSISAVRADLREWLRREARSGEGWIPSRFELAFGLAERERPTADPASVREPVEILDRLKLRGSIDLVESHPEGTLRATDHKTGKTRAEPGVIVGGGKTLQPVLYALACERLLEEPVTSGRLYYCTADGGYQDFVVPLDDQSRQGAAAAIEIIGAALRDGFLPAAPEKGACMWCDYRPVCGPREEIRVRRKPPDRLAELARLREMA